jgi:hypothetical protein
MKTALLFLSCLLFPLAAAAADAPASPACMLVAGGGRQGSSADSDANNHWNRLNFSFFDAALTAVGPDKRVEQAFFSVESADPGRNTDALLAQAAKAGCDKLIALSVFNDPSKADDELVFALRVSPIYLQAKLASGVAEARLGPAEYEKEYRYLANPATLGKVVPSRIAEQAVLDYQRSVKR